MLFGPRLDGRRLPLGRGMYKSLLKWEGQPADVDAAPAAAFKEAGQ